MRINCVLTTPLLLLLRRPRSAQHTHTVSQDPGTTRAPPPPRHTADQGECAGGIFLGLRERERERERERNEERGKRRGERERGQRGQRGRTDKLMLFAARGATLEHQVDDSNINLPWLSYLQWRENLFCFRRRRTSCTSWGRPGGWASSWPPA